MEASGGACINVGIRFSNQLTDLKGRRRFDMSSANEKSVDVIVG